MDNNHTQIHAQVVNIIKKKYGRVDENLMASGIIDSLQAIDLAIELAKEFNLAADYFSLADMTTLSTLIERISNA